MKIKSLNNIIPVIVLALCLQSCGQNNQNTQEDSTSSDSSQQAQLDSIPSNHVNPSDSTKLPDKNVKFLWREKKYNQEVKEDVSQIVLNEDYIKTITDPEKAVLALVATFVGNECEWDGDAKEDRSNLKCKINWALGLGYQCSSKQMDFLKHWFRNEPKILEELQNCPTTPDGATIQDTFDEINLETKGNQIIVSFKANGINLRESTGWTWTEKHTYEIKGDELKLINKEVSKKEESKVTVGEN